MFCERNKPLANRWGGGEEGETEGGGKGEGERGGGEGERGAQSQTLIGGFQNEGRGSKSDTQTHFTARQISFHQITIH